MNVLTIQISWCWIIPVIVGILCAILGYLLGRLFGSTNSNNESSNKKSKLEADLKACKEQRAVLQADLQKCQKAKLGLEKGLSSTNTNVATSLSGNKTSNEILFDAAAAKVAFGKKVKHNDLKIIEGIGPKIEGLFYNFDIKTWKALSETSVKKCQEVLDSGGDRFRMHHPGTWPKQAKLAYQGKWEKLIEWQNKLDGGKA